MERLVFDAQKDAIQDRIKKGSKEGGATWQPLREELRDHEEGMPAEPTPRRYKTNDSTVEKLGELLRDNPAGLLCPTR